MIIGRVTKDVLIEWIIPDMMNSEGNQLIFENKAKT